MRQRKVWKMKTIKIKPDFIKGIPEELYCSAPDMLCRFFSRQYVRCDLFEISLTVVSRICSSGRTIRSAHKNWQCIEAGKEAKLAEYDWDGLEGD